MAIYKYKLPKTDSKTSLFRYFYSLLINTSTLNDGNDMCHFLMLYQIYFSPQVKRRAIISDKHCICQFSHELSKDLKLRIIGN